MTRARIITTGHNGGVIVTTPSERTIAVMGSGGRWGRVARGFIERQIERQLSDGRNADAVARFTRALAFGGCTSAEALGIIRDRDCGHIGTAHDIVDALDLPDRWFRDAWRRSHNGGPIVIDMKAARSVQWRKLRRAFEIENSRRAMDFDALADPVAVNWGDVAAQIKRAADEDDLRRVWIEGIGGKQ